MEPCVSCGNVEPVVPVPTGGCECVTPGGGAQREIRLLAPTRHEYDYWAANDPLIPEGVICIVKDRLFEGSREYIISNSDTDKFSDLTPMAGAPLSRTGAQNHSPLAAEGKSTLDPSWLPDATSSAKGAVMTSTTGAAGKVPIAASGASALDPSWLPAATSSALGGVMTSTTGAADKVPIAGSSDKLDPSWFPEATSTTLGAVKASTTTAANNVVKADANGGLDGWKDAIIDAITADDGSGGLITDSNGNLSVDFSQMPTDKFEALLKSLKMLIPLTATLNLYVDTNSAAAADTIEDGRGTQAKPFKTIQAAVNYVTQTYAINSQYVYINVAAGRYEEHVTLPQYSRTTGRIYLRSQSGQRDVTIVCQSDSNGTVEFGLSVTGGPWYVRYIEIERTEQATTSTTSPIVGCVYVGQNGILYLCGYGITQKMPTGVASLTTNTYRVYNIRLNNGGTLYLEPSSVTPVISMEKPTTGYPEVAGFVLNKKSWMQFNRSASVETPTIKCYGSCNTFISVNEQSSVTVDGAGTRDSFEDNGVTGKRYSVTGSSFINISANATTFPGDTDGTVDNGENGRPQTFCWYD